MLREQNLDEDSATSEQLADANKKAAERVDKLSSADLHSIAEKERKFRAEAMQKFLSTGIGRGGMFMAFLASCFGPIDILFFILAMVTAYKVGSKFGPLKATT